MKAYSFLGCTAIFTLLAAAGCGSGEVAPVKGRVTLDGAALEGATVHFQPTAGKRPSSGLTDADGKFTLKYTADQPGAELGKHKVEIRKEIVIEKAGKEITMPDQVPVKYNTKTTLEKDVGSGINEFHFDLTTK